MSITFLNLILCTGGHGGLDYGSEIPRSYGARLYNLRIQPDAQKEVQEVARQVGDIILPLFPVSWEALTDGTA